MNPTGWTPLGPSCLYNGQLSSKDSTAPVSGRCTAIAIHPTTPATVYAGTASGGVWKTTDQGLNWTPIMDDQISLSVGAMAFDPKNSDRLYVATGEGNPGAEILPGGGLLIFTAAPTAGWELRARADLEGKHIRRIIVDASQTPYRILLATDAGLLQSVDDGASFTKLTIAGAARDDVSDIVYNATDSILYAAVWGDNVYQSVSGADFTPLPKGTGGLFTTDGRIGLAICSSQPQNMYASFADSKNRFVAIRASTDKGASWTVCTLPPPVEDLGQGSYNHVLTVHPNDPNTVFFGERKLWKSTDAGKTWTRVSDANSPSPGLHFDQHALVISPSDPTQVWAGNDGGVWFSKDSGATFFHRNRGLQTMQYYALAQHPDDASILLAGSQDNGSQRYEGHPAWDLTQTGDGFFCAIDQQEPWRWYTSFVFKNEGVITAIQRSEEAGKLDSWKEIVDGISDTYTAVTKPFYVPFVIDPSNHNILYLGTNLLYRTENFGDHWSPVTVSPTFALWTTGTKVDSTITAIAVNPWDANVVYVGTRDGQVFLLERQSNGTYNVTALTGLPAGAYIADIAVAPPVPPATTTTSAYVALGSLHKASAADPDIPEGRIFVTEANPTRQWRSLKTADLDIKISNSDIPHTKNPVNAIAVDPDNPTHIYIGCNVGLFRSTDSGASWASFNDNLPNVAIGDLQYHRKSKLLRAATIGRSVWERKLDASGSPPLADLYIRDNIIDIGRDPAPADAVDPLNKDKHISPFSGADIKIDTPLLGPDFLPLPSTLDYTAQTGADYIAFQQLDPSNELRRRTKSRVYVEVMNRGPADATNVVVRAFYASKSSGYPNLPQDFWSKFPDADPDMSDWKKIGDKVSLGTLPPAQPKVAMWEFETPLGTHDPVGILAVATCQEDPVAQTDFDPAHLATTDKRAALREVSVSFSAAQVVAAIAVALGVASGAP